MKVEHGGKRGRNCCVFSKGEGKRGKRERTQRVNPPFPSHRKKWKLVSLPGRVLLFWCFYSNSFYVPILPTCRVIIMQRVKKNTQMPETIWLLIIRRRQTSMFNSPCWIYATQDEMIHKTHSGTWDKFKMTRYVGLPQKAEMWQWFEQKAQKWDILKNCIGSLFIS